MVGNQRGKGDHKDHAPNKRRKAEIVISYSESSDEAVSQSIHSWTNASGVNQEGLRSGVPQCRLLSNRVIGTVK